MTGASSGPQDAPSPTPISVGVPTITAASAAALVRAAVRAARDVAPVVVAVSDGSGHLVALERMDGARVLAIEVAIDKAWTAAASGMPTGLWNTILTEYPAVKPLGNRARLVGVAGGLPIVENGSVIGAIGVSGGDHAQDQAVAEQALAALFPPPG